MGVPIDTWDAEADCQVERKGDVDRALICAYSLADDDKGAEEAVDHS